MRVVHTRRPTGAMYTTHTRTTRSMTELKDAPHRIPSCPTPPCPVSPHHHITPHHHQRIPFHPNITQPNPSYPSTPSQATPSQLAILPSHTCRSVSTHPTPPHSIQSQSILPHATPLHPTHAIPPQHAFYPAPHYPATSQVQLEIVKSWPSEWCLEANKLAIQVKGCRVADPN